jgi:hypothetical protein
LEPQNRKSYGRLQPHGFPSQAEKMNRTGGKKPHENGVLWIRRKGT